jgi:hypothetical protein
MVDPTLRREGRNALYEFILEEGARNSTPDAPGEPPAICKISILAAGTRGRSMGGALIIEDAIFVRQTCGGWT